jgi:hypothetical protein
MYLLVYDNKWFLNCVCFGTSMMVTYLSYEFGKVYNLCIIRYEPQSWAELYPPSDFCIASAE